MRRPTLRGCLFVAFVLFAWLLAMPARAIPAGAGAPGGRIALSHGTGGEGPVVLMPGQGGLVGQFTISNAGAEPLTVSRIAIRGDEDDVRSPAHVTVHFIDGASTSATLAPGTSKSVVVAWMPDRDSRVRQAFGHVVVTSTDEQAGEVAVGFRAQLSTGLGFVGEHPLTLLVLGPLAVVFFIGVAWLAGRRDEPIVGHVSLVVAVLDLLLAAWAYHSFSADVSRADGNDGFQLIERAVWVRSLGAEWYVGVDGTSLPLVLLAAAISVVATLIACLERRDGAYHAVLALLSAGVMGVVVALDLVLLFGAWQLVWVALLLLVGGWGGARRSLAARKLAIAALLACGTLLFAVALLAQASGPAFLVDGGGVAHTLAIPELWRTSFAGRGPVLGLPLVNVVWILVLLAVAVATPLVPLHGWLPDAVEQGPLSGTLVMSGIVVSLGPYLLIRVGLGALAEGAQWAAPAVATLGALGGLWGALCAMAQDDLRRFVAYTTITTAGMSLYGVGALTPEGISGAVSATFAHGLSAALLLGLAAALKERVHTCDMRRVEALVLDAPALAGVAAIGLGVSLGVPGLAGSWGVLLSLLGGIVRYPGLALVLGAALVASAAAHLRAFRLLLLGQVDPAWRAHRLLEPFGGRLPDASARELLAFAPIAAIAVLLGVWPAPVLSSVTVSARDFSALVDPDGPDR